MTVIEHMLAEGLLYAHLTPISHEASHSLELSLTSISRATQVAIVGAGPFWAHG